MLVTLTRPLTRPSEQAEGGLVVDATSEEWRPVVGHEGYYAVSNLGRVKSVARQIPGSRGDGYRTMPEMVMRPQATAAGYRTVRLSTLGRKCTHYVHALVLTAFRGPCPDGRVCCHNDGDPANNCLDNLRWGTQADNILDQVRHGRHAWARKTHCPHGHEYTPENTLRRNGARACRQCQTNRTARRRAARIAERESAR